MPSMFDEVLAGSRPGEVVFENERTFAFLDAEPAVVGHTLVVSKLEVDQIYDLPLPEYESLWATVRLLAPVLQTVTHTLRVVLSVVGFEVSHAHVHLMPANERAQVFAGTGVAISADELADLAATVRDELRQFLPNSPG